MRSVLAYTTARVALLAVTAGVLYLLGARGLLLIAIAVLVSGVISIVLLSRHRDAVSAAVLDAAHKGRRKFEAARAKEDAETETEDPETPQHRTNPPA